MNALIVFARPVSSERVKTRLELPPRLAKRLYRAFVVDAASQYAALAAADEPTGLAIRWYFAPGGAAVLPPGAGPSATLHRQRGAGLGERMAGAFRETFAAGYRRVVIVGTDHPTMPTDRIRAVFQAIGPDRIGLVPSEDGGFCALGAGRPVPELFAGMTWSHRNVLVDLQARAQQVGLQTTILPGWYDVDRPADLVRLTRELARHPDRAPETAHVVLGERLAAPVADRPGQEFPAEEERKGGATDIARPSAQPTDEHVHTAGDHGPGPNASESGRLERSEEA